MIELKLQNLSGPLPTATYEVQHDGQKVGTVQLRYRPSKGPGVPDGFESHVYYEIDPAQRGRGYAKEALHMIIEEAKKLRMEQLILNIEKGNAASQKVAEANGAKIIAKETGSDGKNYLKYLITL